MTHLHTPGPGDSATWGPCTDPRDPRWDDDGEFHNEISANEQARDEVLATPFSIAWFLNESSDETAPVDTLRSFDDCAKLTTGHLLALMWDSADVTQVMAAREELRTRFLAAVESDIEERAAELVGEPV